jgi:hypothetical protein
MRTACCVSSVNHFAQAEAHLGGLIGELQGASLKAAELTRVEQLVDEGVRELGRQLVQAHIDLRGERETRLRAVHGRDEIRRESERRRARSVTTIFGEVDVTRRAYEAEGEKSLFPMDAELNLTRFTYSQGVERRIAIESARGSFEEATSAFEEATGVKIPKRQAEAIAVRAAYDFDAFYKSVPYSESLASPEKDGLLVLTVDSKGVVMRTEDLREVTRKNALKKVKKLTKRLCRGEKHFAKRMATVASVYEVAPYVRRPEDVIRAKDAVQPVEKDRPKPDKKRLWASVEKDASVVVSEMFEEALRRDPKQKSRWICLLDGSETQLDLIKAEARRHGVKLTIILDMIHVLEYLWKAARQLFEETSQECEAWVTEKMLEILRGKAGLVASGIRRSATFRGLVEKERFAVDKCADYLQKNARYMKYKKYLKRGYPIATGVIEGACRYLVKDRMEITGARWSLSGAEAVLRLRALRASGDFQNYWNFHEAQTHQRNHQAKYAENRCPSRKLRLVSGNA